MARIVESNQELSRRIANALRRTYRTRFPAAKRLIIGHLNQKIRQKFYESTTVKSLLLMRSGSLRSKLGLTEADMKMETILQNILNSIKIKVSVPKGQNVFSINITILPNGFENLFLLAEANQEATKADGSPGLVPSIPWLEWLLERGNAILIQDYYYYGKQHSNHPPPGLGRSGIRGRMQPTSFQQDEGFRIGQGSTNYRHYGTVEDNFITRILDEVLKNLEDELWQIVRPVLIQGS